MSSAFHFPITELDENTDGHWQRRIMPSEHLHYCVASAATWGIARMGLLVPESVMLSVSPAACGRHGAIAGLLLGFKKNLYLLNVDEMDIVTGQHMEKIPQAVSEILATARPCPKAMLICATCIDDLLGSDYDGLALQLEADHEIPIRICHMVPIALDGNLPPIFTVQQAMYDFLEKPEGKTSAVNIIGNFAPIKAESEFHRLMDAAGFGKIRHIADCSTLDEFREMSRSTHNIMIMPNGCMAVQHMEKKLGIPHCFAPFSYGLNAIANAYGTLEEFLDVHLETREYREEARSVAEEYRRRLGRLTVAVGSSVNGSSFELARALTEFDFDVRYIFADRVLECDNEHIRWLKQHNTGIKVFTNIHPTMVDFIEQKLTVDIALGFDAGYFCSGAKTAPLLPDQQTFGYQSVTYLFQEITKALENPVNHREQLYAYGRVI